LNQTTVCGRCSRFWLWARSCHSVLLLAFGSIFGRFCFRSTEIAGGFSWRKALVRFIETKFLLRSIRPEWFGLLSTPERSHCPRLRLGAQFTFFASYVDHSLQLSQRESFLLPARLGPFNHRNGFEFGWFAQKKKDTETMRLKRSPGYHTGCTFWGAFRLSSPIVGFERVST
jgi:hypothetical protein